MDGGVVRGRKEKFSLFVDSLLPRQRAVVTATMTLSNFNGTLAHLDNNLLFIAQWLLSLPQMMREYNVIVPDSTTASFLFVREEDIAKKPV